MSRPTAIVSRLELVDVGPADRVGAGLVELVGIDPTDVVCLEDLRVEHRGGCYSPAIWDPAAVAPGSSLELVYGAETGHGAVR